MFSVAWLYDLFSGLQPIELFLATAGQMIHILARLLKLVRSKKKFIFKKWAIENVLETMLSAICIVVLLIIFKEQMNEILAVTIGYSTDSIFKQVLSRGGSSDKSPFEVLREENEQG